MENSELNGNGLIEQETNSNGSSASDAAEGTTTDVKCELSPTYNEDSVEAILEMARKVISENVGNRRSASQSTTTPESNALMIDQFLNRLSHDSNEVTGVSAVDSPPTEPSNPTPGTPHIPTNDLNSSVMFVNASAIENDNRDIDGDDVIFIDEIQNPNVPIVNLCSPEPECTQARVGKRKQRNKRSHSSPEKAYKNNENDKVIQPTVVIERVVTRTLEISCPICLESTTNRRPHSTICGHIFCQSCISQSLQLDKKCPVCKRKLTQRNIHPIFI